MRSPKEIIEEITKQNKPYAKCGTCNGMAYEGISKHGRKTIVCERCGYVRWVKTNE